MIPRLVALILSVVFIVSAAAFAPRPEHRPNVLVIVIDTLRADRLGAYGNTRELTPVLDRLASRGTVFERAYAPSSWTIPSVASMFTSRHPTQHQVVTFWSILADDEVTIAERLRDSGWAVGGFSANPNLRVDRGFGQGFNHLWADLTTAEKVPADVVIKEALAWLRETQDRWSEAASPIALYVHLMEPHEPYTSHEPFRTRFAVDDDGDRNDSERTPRDARSTLQGQERIARANARNYDALVAEADDHVGRLLDELERIGFLKDSLIVVTADHGEEFLEHGRTSHGRTLYEESVRVPLILVGQNVPAGRRVSTNVSLIDLAPTLMELLGLPTPSQFEGRSLSSVMGTGADESGDVDGGPAILLQLESVVVGKLDNRAHSRGFIDGGQKLLVGPTGSTEVFDLALDPFERQANVAGLAERAGSLQGQLRVGEGGVGRSTTIAPPPVPIDQGLRDRLEALGYVP